MESRTRKEAKLETVRNLRARRREQGRILLTTDLPSDLVEAIDRIKEEQGLRGRTPVLEEALRAYVEQRESKHGRSRANSRAE